MKDLLSEGANFAIFAAFLGGVLGGLFAAIYKYLIVPKLNSHIDSVVTPIKGDLTDVKESLAEVLRNGHQNPADPSIRDQLSTLVDLVGEHIKVADVDHNLLAQTVADVKELKAAS